MPTEAQQGSNRWWILLVVVVCSAWALALQRFHPHYFLLDDNADRFLPFYHYNYKAVVEHLTLPIVNLHQYLGNYYLGKGQTAVLYPPVYLGVLLSKLFSGDSLWTIDILVYLHLLLGSVSMFYLLRFFQISRVICCVLAILWGTFPFFIILSKAWVVIALVQGYLPLFLLYFEKLRATPCFKLAFILALLKALVFFQGNVQYVINMALFELVFILLRLRWHGWKREKPFLIMLGFSYTFLLFLTAPLLFPMIHAQQDSLNRSSRWSFYYFVRHFMEFAAFAKAQIFSFSPEAVFAGRSQMYYFGLPCLYLCVVALLPKPFAALRTRGVAAYPLQTILALCSASILFGLLYPLPVLNHFRWPFRNFMYFLLFGTVTIGLVSQLWIDTKVKSGKQLLIAFAAISLFSNALVIYTNQNQTLAPYTIEDPPDNRMLEAIDFSQGRVMTYKVSPPIERNIYRYITFNFATLFGIYDLGGWDPLVAKANIALAKNLYHINQFTEDLNQELLDHLSNWSVRHIITINQPELREELLAWDQLREAYADEEVLVVENTRALPFVTWQDEPSVQVPVNFNINTLEIDATSTETRKLSLSLAPSPLLFRHHGGFQFSPLDEFDPRSDNLIEWRPSIELPPGEHRVKLVYLPVPLVIGLAMSVLGFGIFFLRVRKRISL